MFVSKNASFFCPILKYILQIEFSFKHYFRNTKTPVVIYLNFLIFNPLSPFNGQTLSAAVYTQNVLNLHIKMTI